uniref:Uncharacterized protein n=1 Tax=Anguilla anguilla TaxID=7936 RepID=A0A0E9TPZ1_ANGAN
MIIHNLLIKHLIGIYEPMKKFLLSTEMNNYWFRLVCHRQHLEAP